MSDGVETKILETARKSGWAAARLCRAVQESIGGVEALYKEAREPVTVADYGSQALILEAVSRAFPEHAVIAEEGAEHLRRDSEPAMQELITRLVGDVIGRDVAFDDVCGWIDHTGGTESEYTWVIDPIDGTKGFLRGDQYAVAIGILRHGVPWGGVLACPNLPLDADSPHGPRGSLFVAARGHGVTRAELDSDVETTVRVSEVEAPEGVRILGSVESAHGDPVVVTSLIEALGLGGGVVRLDSQAKYATVGAGVAEIYLRPQSRPDYREKIWDHAAGVVVVEEAGGTVSDLYGRPLDFSLGRSLENNRGVVATNGRIHDDVLGALAGIIGSEPS